MRHVLIINHNAGSPYHGPNFRSYYAAHGWVQQGMKATIVCSAFSHKLSQLPDVPGPFLKQNIDGIDYLWLKTTPFRGNVGRLRNFWEFSRRLRNVAELVPEPVDHVVCSSPPPFWIWASQGLARAKGASLIFEARDLWPDVIFETTRLGRINPAAWLMRRAEVKAYREADAVISVNASAIKVMEGRGLSEDRFWPIPNGTTLETADLRAVDLPARDLCEGLRREGWTVVGYSGALSKVYGLEYLAGAAPALAEQKIALVLAGTGPYQAELEALAARHANLHLVGWVPKEALPVFLGSVDICFAGLLDVPSFAFGSDSTKLYEYMKVRKPILHSHRDPDSVVVQAGCGLRVVPESGEAIVEGLCEMLSRGGEGLAELGARGRQFLEANRRYEVLTARWLELFETLEQRNRARERQS